MKKDSIDENFLDGRNPENKGDMARHGLKGKTITQLKAIRSSKNTSPRKKQLAHWYINMHKEEHTIGEDLRKWFREKWVRMDTKGNIKGDCAREPGEGKPKCLPLAKARAMDKKDRATATKRKRREDPVADRPGKGGAPVNVRTEQIEYIEEKNAPTNPELWSRAKTLARSKFDVYPSAYANGWAAKWYKSKGGSWKAVGEEMTNPYTDVLTQLEEAKATYCGRCGTTHVAPKFGGKCPALKEEQLNEFLPALIGIIGRGAAAVGRGAASAGRGAASAGRAATRAGAGVGGAARRIGIGAGTGIGVGSVIKGVGSGVGSVIKGVGDALGSALGGSGSDDDDAETTKKNKKMTAHNLEYVREATSARLRLAAALQRERERRELKDQARAAREAAAKPISFNTYTKTKGTNDEKTN